MSDADNFRFAAVLLSLIVLPLVPALVRSWRGRRSGAAIPLIGIEYLQDKRYDMARRRNRYRAVLLGSIVIGLGFLWAGPEFRTGRPMFDGGERMLHKNLIMAIDVSRSMSGPLEMPDKEARLAAYGQGRANVEPGQSRFDAARETVYSFVERFPGARIGLILFSTEPFLARWPTTETEQRFREILEEDLRNNSQLSRLASLTNTDAALQLARDVFAGHSLSHGGAVILISDAEDELEHMGIAIRSLRNDGIRLYAIGVGISETVTRKLSEDFSDDPGFRIFRADSEEQMQHAYRLVSELEDSPRYADEERAYVTDLRWLIAAMLAVYSSLAMLLIETRLNRSTVASG